MKWHKRNISRLYSKVTLPQLKQRADDRFRESESKMFVLERKRKSVTNQTLKSLVFYLKTSENVFELCDNRIFTLVADMQVSQNALI